MAAQPHSHGHAQQNITAIFISIGRFHKKYIGGQGLNGPLSTMPSFFPTKHYLLNYLSFSKHISIGKTCYIFSLSEHSRPTWCTENYMSVFREHAKCIKQAKEVQHVFVRNLNGEGHVNYTQCTHACRGVGWGMWQPLWAVYCRLGCQWVGSMGGLLG